MHCGDSGQRPGPTVAVGLGNRVRAEDLPGDSVLLFALGAAAAAVGTVLEIKASKKKNKL